MAAIRSEADADDLLDEIVDRYGEPPKGVINLVDVALLRALARGAGITDIRQKAGDVLFVIPNLSFEAVTRMCGDSSYKNRITLVATAKEPTLKLKLSAGVDSLAFPKSKLTVNSLAFLRIYGIIVLPHLQRKECLSWNLILKTGTTPSCRCSGSGLPGYKRIKSSSGKCC